MGQRGRKTTGVAIAEPSVSLMQRPEAPLDLTPEESDVWVSVVEALPGDWFKPETFPLLTQYCRHTVSARRVAQLIDAEMSRDDVDPVAIKDLLTMQRGETASLKALAASMRLAQQSSRTDGSAGTAKRNRSVSRPWEG